MEYKAQMQFIHTKQWKGTATDSEISFKQGNEKKKTGTGYRYA